MSGPVLAIVPARGHSRRLPGKNLRDLCGKPLLAWTIEAARGAASITRVVVSTEDEAIAACARRYLADVPVLRPPALAQDESPGIDPILHMADWLEQSEGYAPEIVVVLQPTSPLRLSRDIDDCIGLMRARGASAVVSVSPAPCPPSWFRHVDADGRLREGIPAREDEPEFVINGAVYATTLANLKAARSTYADDTLAYIMPRERGVDIDTEYDFVVAECLARQQR